VSALTRDRRIVRRRPGRVAAGARSAGRRAAAGATGSGARTALQKHVDFFDTDHDGLITLLDTYRGLRRLGVGTLRSAAFAGVINAALGSATSGTPSLTVDAGRIHAGIHGSDTGVYDRDGRFSRSRLTRLFARYDPEGNDTLDAGQLGRLFADHRTDLVGHLGSRAEFALLLELAGEERGGRRVLTRERLEQFYEGSLFSRIAEEVSARRERDWAALRAVLSGSRRELY